MLCYGSLSVHVPQTHEGDRAPLSRKPVSVFPAEPEANGIQLGLARVAAGVEAQDFLALFFADAFGIFLQQQRAQKIVDGRADRGVQPLGSIDGNVDVTAVFLAGAVGFAKQDRRRIDAPDLALARSGDFRRRSL